MAKKPLKKSKPSSSADPSKELPLLVVAGKKIQLKASDLKRPKWDYEDKSKNEQLTHEERRALTGDSEGSYTDSLTFYYTENCGWVVLTLHISNPSRSQKSRGISTERSYGRQLNNGQLVTVGRGPHVLREVTIYFKNNNQERVKPFIDEYNKGLKEACEYRDRLSTRRANSRSRGYGGFFSAWNS